ncbi:MAG: amidohydrolase [Planctomycetes bacterium]|nr:amidohydrolase [Planctomycetota bacterium]
MRSLFLIVTLFPYLTSTLRGQEEQPARGPDLIVVGPVLTLDESRPRAGGLVIQDGKILRITDAASARAAAGPGTRIMEVPASGVAMPGVIESHAHLRSVGTAMRQLDLRGVESPAAAAERVREWCADLPADSWVVGRGWSQELWERKSFPDRKTLDLVCGGRPCALRRTDGHALWVSSKTLELSGISDDIPNPPGGEVIKDASGRVTGILVDKAMDLVERVMPKEDDPDEIAADLLAAQKEALRLGITTFVDAGADPGTLRRLAELYAGSRMKLRVHAMVSVDDAVSADRVLAGPPILSAYDDRFAVRALKLYADGALGSRGAWLLDSYADRAAHRGFAILQPKFIEDVARRALKMGYQVCTHAIGDRGCRETLDAYERALDATRAHGSDHRFRIEHAQILSAQDIPRFKKLGVIPSMQGCHCTSDGPWVPARLGQRRSETGAYAWRSLIDAGCIIPNGTDAPVESLSPWLNLFSTTTRFMQMPDGRHDAFYPRQRMNRHEALQSLTQWGAQGSFTEDRRGKLRPGFQADVVIINRDPITCSVWHMSRIGVIATVIAGEVVYEKRAQ